MNLQDAGWCTCGVIPAEENFMFPGANKLQLNHSCMIEAVQMYLDSKFKEGEGPKVTNVKEQAGPSQTGRHFEIDTKATDETTKAAE